MACFLPFRPWFCLDLRVFGFLTAGDLSTHPSASPLLHLRATSVAFPNTCCFAQKTKPTLPFFQSSSHQSATLQHIQTKEPFFSTWRLPSVQTALPHCLKVPSSGFGYPLDGVSSFILGSNLSTPHAHGFHSSGLFSSFVAGLAFPQTLPLVRFSTKPPGLVPTLQRV
jgi:hypothetical protein